MTNKIIPIRLSHSTLEILHECERKFQLERLLQNPLVREESEHTVFGKAYGVGIATYLTTQDSDQALYEAWLAYWPELESDKKNIALCMSSLLSAFPKLDDLLMENDVAIFNGKPAIELSFRLNISEEFYFVGYIDVVLRNRSTGIYSVVDAKSTGLALLDLSPLYQNSGQVLGYSLALDKIVGEKLSNYDCTFVVAQVNAKALTCKTHILTYPKTLLDRLKWFMTLGEDVKHMELMREMNHYPMRGSSCLHFMRPCRYFNSCHLTSLDFPKPETPDEVVYDFVFDMNEVIADHVERINKDKSSKTTTTLLNTTSLEDIQQLT